MHLSPRWLKLLSVLGGGSVVVVDILFYVLLIVCGGSMFVFFMFNFMSILVLQSS